MYKSIFLSLITMTSCAQRRQIVFNYERLEEIDRCTSTSCREQQGNNNNPSLSTILTPGDSISSSVDTIPPASSCNNWQLDSVSPNLDWHEVSGLVISKKDSAL